MEFSIRSIQRERTQYVKLKKDYYKWSFELETKASKNFQKQLRGTHPSEFLLSEFLFRNRKEMRENLSKGKLEVTLVVPNNNFSNKIYRPLIERFFSRITPKDHLSLDLEYKLSLKKKRVQQILGIKVNKNGEITFLD